MSRILFAHIDGTTHEQTIICRQLFAGHVVGSRPMKRKEKMHRMIKKISHRSSRSAKCAELLQRMAKECTNIHNARAQPLFCSLSLLFDDVLVAVSVVVCLSSLITPKRR